MADFIDRLGVDETDSAWDYLRSKGLAAGLDRKAQELRGGNPPAPEPEKKEEKPALSPQSTGILSTPPPLPPSPNLRDVPRTPQQQFSEPFEVFKSPAIVLASLGSLFTRHPLTTALNAATGAMQGFQKGQKDIADEKRKEWEDNLKAALEQNKIELERYKDAWERRNIDVKDKFAQLYAQAAGNNDPVVSAAIQSGNIEMVEKVISAREAAQTRLTGLVEQLKVKEEFAAGQNDPQTIDVLARRLNEGDTTAIQNVGRGAQGAEMIKAIRKRQGEILMQEQGMTAQQAADHITSKTAEFGGIRAGERTLGTRTANIEMAVNEAYNMLPAAQAASEAVPRTKWLALNRAIQEGKVQSGDPDIARFLAAHNAVINTYARAISPSGVPTVADKEHAREIFSTATSPEAYKAVLDQIRIELEAARRSPGQVREEFRTGTTGGAIAAPGGTTSSGIKWSVQP